MILREATETDHTSIQTMFYCNYLQATVCTDFIGWRERARHLLLMATDADFHIAGDGRLGGVVRPHDGQCYLEKETDELFIYTKAEEFDYPSVFQINDKLVQNDIVPLFAVTDREEYDRLVSNDTVSCFCLFRILLCRLYYSIVAQF